MLLQRLIPELIRSAQSCQRGNHDGWRFPRTPAARLKERVKVALGYAAPFDSSASLEHILDHAGEFERAYRLLSDEESRTLMVELLKFRVLGESRVRLPTNNERAARLRSEVKSHRRKRGTVSAPPFSLDLYNVGGVRLHCHALNVLNTFLLEQYAYSRGGVSVTAEEGDVVIDAGGCWGDTALYFAARGCHVHCFEFVPANLEVLRRNLALNPGLAVDVVESPLWESVGEEVRFDLRGPGTRASETGEPFKTETIDNYVARTGIPVGFIKMDIEGAELKALKGAEETLGRYRPKLAISLYHREEDFYAIPSYLDSLNLGYRLHLDHFTIHREETVLFALP